MFPVEVHQSEVDDRGLFVVQDVELRSRILPLFSFNPQATHARVEGHGTTFRIDKWSQCATAYHVVEDLFELDGTGTAVLKADIRLAALELNGYAYGQIPLSTEVWRPFAGSYTLLRIETPIFQEARLRNLTELAALRIHPSRITQAGTPYLPVDLRRWRPRIGERVMALGYADLDRRPADMACDRPITQNLYGSMGEISDIEPANGRRAQPWPLIRVAVEWPGGMSGGPVFNEAGHVVGVVSSGIEGMGVGSATYFSSWDMPERLFVSLDPSNPGWFICHGAFDDDNNLRHAGQDLEEVRRFARAHGLRDVGRVSINPQADEYIRSQ